MTKEHVLLTNKLALPLPMGKPKSQGVEKKRVKWTHPCLVGLAGPPRKTQLASSPKKLTKHTAKHVNTEERVEHPEKCVKHPGKCINT